MFVGKVSGFILIKIPPGKERVRDVVLWFVFHLSHCSEIHGVVAPNQCGVVLFV